MNLLPASIIYRDMGIPRSMLHDLVERGVIDCDVRHLPDGRTMKLYDADKIAAWMNQGERDGQQS